MYLAHDHHHIIPHFNKELKELYASMSIRGFAVSLVGVFIPIYLFQFFENSISKVLFFYATAAILVALISPFTGKIITTIGIKHSMLLSIPFLFLYYLGIWHIDKLGTWFLILPIIRAVFTSFYWPAYHMDFARFSDEGRRGSEFSFVLILLSSVAAVAPFIGGVVITKYGFPFLFGMVLSFLFASIIPLFLSKDIKQDYNISYIGVIKSALKKSNRNMSLSFASWGMATSIIFYIWPIFLFITAINFEELGVITSGILFLGIFFQYFFGKTSDKEGAENLITPTSVALSIFMGLQILITSPLSAFVMGSFRKFSSSATDISYMSLVYEWAGKKKDDIDEKIIIREVVHNFSRGLFLLFLALLFLKFGPEHLKYIFILGSILVLGINFILGAKEKK